ncbi:MAG: hypothetical protein K8T90_13115 [Planctomycetes bacterium]|nr:hypothetical protein [Planctomycetota bacterium]
MRTPGRNGLRYWLASLLVLALAVPRVETLPLSERIADVPPPEMLVRVAAGGTAGVRLVYDKRRSWFRAKTAEIFPRIARGTMPADYAEDAAGALTERRVEVHLPWWR